MRECSIGKAEHTIGKAERSVGKAECSGGKAECSGGKPDCLVGKAAKKGDNNQRLQRFLNNNIVQGFFLHYPLWVKLCRGTSEKLINLDT